MEDKYRTLAAVIAAIIGEIVSYYFFRGFLGIAAIATIVLLLLFHFSPFPILVSILISIDANLIRQDRLSDFYIVSGVTLAIILLGIFSEILDQKEKRYSIKPIKKEVVSNCLAMSLGILAAFVLQSFRCPSIATSTDTLSESLVSSWFGVHACATIPLRNALTTAFTSKEISIPSIINAILLMLLFIPLTWGLIFTALRQARFNLKRFPSIIGYIFIGLVGWFLSYIPYQIVLWIIGAFAVIVMKLETPPPELLFVSLLLDLTISTLCVGYLTAKIARRGITA